MRFASLLLIALLIPWPLLAEQLGAPSLPAPLSTAGFIDTNRLLTTGGVSFYSSSDFTLEPELGVGHRATERELPGRLNESVHNVHAQAGARLSLPQSLYLSAAAKLPVFTYESTFRTGQDLALRQNYDFGHPLKTGLSWTGEFGVHLFSNTDFTLYYDQGFANRGVPGLAEQEERVGSRINLRFK